MQAYYSSFYGDTWIFDLDKIINDYSEIYENLKKEILIDIYNISQEWLIWRKIIEVDWDIEFCSYTLIKRSYRVTFFSIKNNRENRVVIYDLRIEV